MSKNKENPKSGNGFIILQYGSIFQFTGHNPTNNLPFSEIHVVFRTKEAGLTEYRVMAYFD